MDHNLIHELCDLDNMSFEVVKISNPKLVWRDTSIDSGLLSNEKLLCDNSYVVPTSACFKNIPLDSNNSKLLRAERYGGVGLGFNGGGGRCGNSTDFQLKGIGSNCMVGTASDKIHSYGGMDAPLAIIECINTKLISMVSPQGAVRISGIIYVGGKTAFYHHPSNKCWGVILVRDHCIRPAQLLRAPLFKTNPENGIRLTEDTARIRRLNKQLLKKIKNPSLYIKYLGDFLQKSANQFGFARAAHVMHGAITPSNMTLNGEWLDLPLASFVNSGVNQGLSSNFFEECFTPASVTEELIHNFSKYNEITLTSQPLINYYDEQLTAYTRYHVAYNLGFDPSLIQNQESEDWVLITNLFFKLAQCDASVSNKDIVFTQNDPIKALVEGIFACFKSGNNADIFFSKLKIDPRDFKRIQRSVVSVMVSVHQTFNSRAQITETLIFDDFIKGTNLLAYKRIYLSSFFFSTRIADSVWKFCETQDVNDLGFFINEHINIMAWIFEPLTNTITLFESNKLRIEYVLESTDLNLRVDQRETQSFSSFNHLLAHIDQHRRQSVIIEEFDFYPFLKHIGKSNLIEH